MSRIKIEDLSVDLTELQKKDPKILNKIRGGWKRPLPIISKPTDSKFALCDTCNFGCPSLIDY